MKHWLRTLLDSATTWGGSALVLLLGFWVAYQYVEPAPPGTIRMATGAEDGAYHRFAQRYQAAMPEGVSLELVPSGGSVANLALLNRSDTPVDVAFVQGGVEVAGMEETLASLASLYYEPVWVFHRDDREARTLRDLEGWRIGIGAAGSGIQPVARELLRANGVTTSATLLELDNASGADALIGGELDALFVIASPTAGVIQRLVEAESVQLMDFPRADAYVRRHPHFARLDLPEGVLDLQANLPPRPQRLLGVTANLVARRDLHPALADLMLQVAARVHAPAGLFEDREEFPSRSYLLLPLDPDAERYYRYGPPLLQRYLPFWAANLVDRLKIMLVPLIALLLPLLKLTPPIYQWRIRSRVYRWYGDLQHLDPSRGEGDATREERLAALEALESEVNQVKVPLSYADELYHLRTHIELVRRRLEPVEPGQPTSSQ